MMTMYAFLSGMVTMACLTVAVYFYHFWTQTKDRFFVIFSGAFVVLGLERLIPFLMEFRDDTRHYNNIFRLGAFILIAYAVYDKNRVRK